MERICLSQDVCGALRRTLKFVAPSSHLSEGISVKGQPKQSLHLMHHTVGYEGQYTPLVEPLTTPRLGLACLFTTQFQHLFVLLCIAHSSSTPKSLILQFTSSGLRLSPRRCLLQGCIKNFEPHNAPATSTDMILDLRDDRL